MNIARCKTPQREPQPFNAPLACQTSEMSTAVIDLYLERIELLVDVLHDGQLPPGNHRLAPTLNVDRGVVVAVQMSCAFDV